ncbi:receptor-like protein 7 [Rhodamnia argentea]|uniref:Receptor-like protein 7 n=1 Tax=Rhodamnia argentea TaxID=178133 RepID=A0A8B8NV03_9MYRT|nr:receptor-like protein 7 [Rhodamnia argentea]
MTQLQYLSIFTSPTRQNQNPREALSSLVIMKRTPFDLLLVFLAIIPLHFASSETLPSTRPTKCHEQERSALLEFKQSLFHPEAENCLLWGWSDPSKLESWKLEDGDCCSWEGVECDEGTGYVTGLDLSRSCLFGPINSNTSLFRLTHLQSLNLAINNFDNSQIPSAIGDLVELTSLDLSFTSFAGQIPSQVLKLTDLSFLDLSSNRGLELRNPSMETVVQSLTKLEHLDLSSVNVSALIPDSVANLSFLTSLVLPGCDLRGTFPAAIFELPRLQLLDLGYNPELSGHLPEFHLHSPIKSLFLGRTNCSGNIPSSIGNLTQLTTLHFRDNKLSGEIPSSLGKLIQLSSLDLSMNQLSGEIPASLINLTNLAFLNLQDNQLTGHIPAEITGLTRLTYLDLSFNRLIGSIPEDISNLENLTVLNLQSNKLNGTLRLDVVLKLQYLTRLLLSFNKFSSIIEPDVHAGLSNLSIVGLASSNLSEFPIFLAYQSRLQGLDLSQNSIYGPTPPWFLNVSMAQLVFLNLSGNFITSFAAFRWPNLLALDLRYNNLQGLLPIPPKAIQGYFVSNNNLSGEISPGMCELSSIMILDLSKNKLIGDIPPCLSNLSETLQVLSLHGNGLHGRFPELKDVCALNMIDLSDNQLQGSLPKGLANCTNLEFLNFGNNHIIDTFPSWMGSLSNLKVLILHSNRFHGAIGEPKARDQFPNLRIVDLSMNNFSSCLPSEYFNIWSAMKVHYADDENYYGNYLPFYFLYLNEGKYDYSMTIMNRGIATEYERVLSYLTVIDLSSNGFIGEIPNSVGSLAELHLLNLSNNALTGSIPLSLANLTELESLDLSSNNLSGMIPPALTQLNFLAFFNVSDNHLSGPIPQANQFATFENDSYGGNLGLCGVPLTKKCGNPAEAPPAPPSGAFAKEDLGTWFEGLDWKIVLMGLGSGLVVGVLVGLNTTSGIERWFLRLYRGEPRRQMHQVRFA